MPAAITTPPTARRAPSPHGADAAALFLRLCRQSPGDGVTVEQVTARTSLPAGRLRRAADRLTEAGLLVRQTRHGNPPDVYRPHPDADPRTPLPADLSDPPPPPAPTTTTTTTTPAPPPPPALAPAPAAADPLVRLVAERCDARRPATVGELSAADGRSIYLVRKALRALAASGALRRVPPGDFQRGECYSLPLADQ